MGKMQTLSIIFYALIALGSGLPVGVPRHKQLGYKLPRSVTNSSGYNNSYVPTKDRLGETTTTTASTTAGPHFEYALLGQDPKDQHWYRVSLTSTDKKSGFRAQFATRKSPPYDAQLAHKHDKTIKELLKFLEKSEEHNLLKVYGQLLDSGNDEESKNKRNADKVEIDVDNDLDEMSNDLKTDANRSLLLVGELSENTTPVNRQNGSDSTMFQNFVYFIKGLK